MAPKNPKPKPKTETESATGAPAVPTDPAELFKARFNKRATILNRQFKALARLGTARKARMTPEQYEKVKAWLAERVEYTVREMGRRLESGPAKASDEPSVL